VVCSWLGTSPHHASHRPTDYLLVTEDDFVKAAGAKKEGRGDACHPFVPPTNWAIPCVPPIRATHPLGDPNGEVHSAPPTQLKK